MRNDINVFYRGGERPVAGEPRLWTLTFLTFVALNLFIFMGFDILLPTLSLYLEGHGRSESEIGRIFGTFTVSAVLVRMFAGRLSRRFDAMWLARLGLMGCAVAGACYFWSHGVISGVAARFLHGAGFGLAQTLMMALASQIIPPARMGEGMGYLGLGTTLALAIGPFFGIWLMEDFGYFTMFMVVAAFYVASMLMLSLLPKIQLASARPDAPVPPIVMVSRRVMIPSVLIFIIGLAMSSVSIFMALYCKEKGLPYAGHFFVFSAIGLFVARLFAGRIHDRAGHMYVILPAGLILLACMLLLWLTADRDILFAVSILYGLCSGAVFPSIQALTMEAVPLNARTEATASFFNAFDLGLGAGSLGLGYLASHLGTYSSVYLGGAIVSVVFLAFYLIYYLVIKKRLKPAAEVKSEAG
ncbi:MFS transporter [Deltaproteobacteria bacterium OttesenSCG-928-M10]|nr:MFS transporter [Deltaproteobacteria bacterium OttesenSCG-928-M10]